MGLQVVRMEACEKRASSGNSTVEKCDHSNNEVGDAREGHGRRVVKLIEVWAGSGRDKPIRTSFYPGRFCMEGTERTGK